MAFLNRKINKFLEEQVMYGQDSNFSLEDVYEEFGKEKIDKFIEKHNKEKHIDLELSFTEKLYKSILGVDPSRVTANVLKDLKMN